MIPLPLSKRDIFSPTTRLRHVPVKRRAGLALICLGTQILEEVFMVILKRKGKKHLFFASMCLFSLHVSYFSCSSLPRITLASVGHACGWHKGSEKEGQSKYSTLLFSRLPAPPPGPSKVRPLPIIEGVFFGVFFYVTKSSGYFVRLPLPCVVCAFAFYNSPKMRVFLLFKGVIEVKAMVRCQRSMWRLQTFMKLLCRDSGRN